MGLRRCTLEHKRKVSESKKGNKNSMWKGDKVGYNAVHAWIKRNHSMPKLCEDCNLKKAQELANIDGIFKRDMKHWRWLCCSCHSKRDMIIYNLRTAKLTNNSRLKMSKAHKEIVKLRKRDKRGRFIIGLWKKEWR